MQTVPVESDWLPYGGFGNLLGPRSQVLDDRPYHDHWKTGDSAPGRKRGNPVSYYPGL